MPLVFDVTAVVRFDNVQGGAFQRIFDFSNGAEQDEILFGNLGTTNGIIFETIKDGIRYRMTIDDVITNGETSTWRATIDDQGEFQIFKDGTLISDMSTDFTVYDQSFQDVTPQTLPTADAIPRDVPRDEILVGQSPFWHDADLIGSVDSLEINTTFENGFNLTNTEALDDVDSYAGSDVGEAADASANSEGTSLDGRGGDDSLTGGSGDDTLTGGDGSDTISGGAGADVISGDAALGAASKFFVEYIDVDGRTNNAEASALDTYFDLSNGSIDVAHLSTAPSGAVVRVNPFGTTESDSIDPNALNSQIGYNDTYGHAYRFSTNLEVEGGTYQFDASMYNSAALYIDGTQVFFNEGSGAGTATGSINLGEGVHEVVLIYAKDRTANPDDLDVLISGEEFGAAGLDLAEAAVAYIYGDDSLSGGDGDDTIDGGLGDDTLDGGADNDSLGGGSGDDLLSGGSGSDDVSGGFGDDTIDGGLGDDTLTGGTGDDTFVVSQNTGTDFLSDFELPGGELSAGGDRLDISSLRGGSGPDGTLTLSDIQVADDGQGNAQITFPGGESVVLFGVSPDYFDTKKKFTDVGIPCFASGTMITTQRGTVPVETLRLTDRILSHNGQAQRIAWLGKVTLDTTQLQTQAELRPVRLRAGAIGNDQDLWVSQQHAFLVGTYLVRAKHIAEFCGPTVARIDETVTQITYHHVFLQDGHGTLIADGAISESFWPGPTALNALGAESLLKLVAAAPTAFGDAGSHRLTYPGPCFPYATAADIQSGAVRLEKGHAVKLLQNKRRHEYQKREREMGQAWFI